MYNTADMRFPDFTGVNDVHTRAHVQRFPLISLLILETATITFHGYLLLLYKYLFLLKVMCAHSSAG